MMSDLTMLLTGAAGKSIGWALVHLTWQAAIVAIALAVVIRALRGAAASTRYAVAVAALGLTLLLPIVTAVRMHGAMSGGAIPVAVTAPNATLPIAASPADAPSVTAMASQPRIEVERSLPWIVLAWFLGVIALSFRLALQWWRMRSLVRSSSLGIDQRWEGMTDRLARKLHLKTLIQLAESAAVEVPTVVGWLRPVILMPVSALSGLTPEQIETILAHEIAHIRRHDYLVNLAQTAIETLLFYHPGVWWISRQIRIERENCCDDLAVKLCGNPVVYARALTVLEQMRATLPGTAIASNGGSLLERIRRLVGRSDSRDAWSIPAAGGIAIAAAALTALFVITPMARAAKGNHEKPAAAKKPHYEMTVTSSSTRAHGSSTTVDVDLPAVPEPPTPPEAPDLSPVIEALLPGLGQTSPAIPAAPAAPLPPAAIAPVTIPAPPAVPMPPAPPDVVGALSTGTISIDLGPKIAMKLALAEALTGDSDTDEKPFDPNHPSVDDLIRLRDSGITPAYIKAVRDLYPDASLNDIARLRRIGGKVEWIHQMRSTFGNDIAIRDLVRLGAVGVTPDYVSAMKKAGLHTSVEDIVRLRGVGVTPDYIEKMRPLGARTAEDMVRMRGVGVTVDYAAEMKKIFGRTLDANELVRLRGVGVTPDYVDSIRPLAHGHLDVEDLIRLRGVGVNPDWASEMAKTFGHQVPLEDLVRLRGVGVTPNVVAALRKAFGSVSPEDAIRAKGVGVDPNDVAKWASQGLGTLTLDDLIRIHGVGVTARYAAEMKALGFDSLSADDLIRLRGVGVTPDYVRELRSAGLTNLTPDDLIRLKGSGIDAKFLGELKRSKN